MPPLHTDNDAPARALAESLIADTAALVSPPQICLAVAELVQSPDCSLNKLGEVIIRDPNLTARLLRLVNSPFYGFSGKIDTVSRALMVVGLQELNNMVVAISAVKSFSKIANKLVNMDTFWRHGIYCGLVARLLARRNQVLHPERLFIAGLMHDLGSLVLYHRLPEISQDVLLAAAGDEEVLYQAEVEMIGFSHADLGALLMERWRLPETLQDAVRCHHAPAAARSARVEAAVLHVANVLANRSGIGGYCEHTVDANALDPAAVALLTPETFDEVALLTEAGAQFSDTASILAAA
ncbi:MAG: HDOD domain-containing protein [Gammaproteobacteria bacterium]